MLCRACAASLARSLATAASLAGDLDDAVARLLKRGSGGGKRSGDDNPLPIDTGAMDARDALRNALSGWVRVIREMPYRADDPWPRDTVASMARWLHLRLDAIRQHEAAADIHDEITSAVARAAVVVDRQPERTPAGTCEACGAQLLAELGADEVRCSCGMLTTALRQKRTDRAAAADVLGSAGEISGALGKIGISVPRGTITSWASRGRLTARPGKRNGQSVYAMSEVLALSSERTAR
jgi:hypothetical protein